MAAGTRHAATVFATLLAVVAIQVAFLALVVGMAVPLLVLPGMALGSLPGRTLGIESVPRPVLVVFALLGLAAFGYAQLRYARREALSRVDAESVGEGYPGLQARVRRLAMVAGVEPPSVAVTPSPTATSFGIGGPRSTVVVSRGLLDRPDDVELDAALAHELAHVADRDATVMTMAAFLPALVSERYSLLRETYPFEFPATVAAGTVATLLATVFVLLELGSVGLLVPVVVPVVVLLDYLFGWIVVDGIVDGRAARSAGTGGASGGTDSRGPFDGGGVEPLSLVPSGPVADASPGLFDRGGDPWNGHRTHPSTADRVEHLRATTVNLEAE